MTPRAELLPCPIKEEVVKLIEKIDALYAKATPGLWTQGARYLCALNDGMYDPLATICKQSDLDSEKWNSNTRLIIALVNAWPQLRDALRSLPTPPKGEKKWS